MWLSRQKEKKKKKETHTPLFGSNQSDPQTTKLVSQDNSKQVQQVYE